MTILRFNDRNQLTTHFNAMGKESDPKTHYLVEREGTLYVGSPGKDGFINIGYALATVFPGDRLFQLRATHGLPLDSALDMIQEARLAVDWVGFMTEARKNGWYDFQTLEAIENALKDAEWFNHDIPGIIKRLKVWIMANPLERV